MCMVLVGSIVVVWCQLLVSSNVVSSIVVVWCQLLVGSNGLGSGIGW